MLSVNGYTGDVWYHTWQRWLTTTPATGRGPAFNNC